MNPTQFSKAALVVAFALMLALYGSAPLILPKPVPASAPPDRFSAERTMNHLRTLSQEARVVGTPGMVRTVNYLVESLRSYGLKAEIQESSSVKGNLRNVIVRIPGRDSNRALLILTHSDSVSYGAGDNASGVAVLLETARALQAGDQPQNDVILLFDDGEEEGYWGGYAFSQVQSQMKNIQCVIGLDTAAWGPVILLQATPGNGDLVRFYAGSVPSPSAFGFFADADWNISHDTSEIQPFYELGLPGLAMEDPTAYIGKHSGADTADYIRPGSLQQMGDQTLALARSFGDKYQAQALIGNLSFFTLWRIGVIHFPANWNVILVGIGAIGLATLIGLRIKRKEVKTRNLVSSAVFLLLAVLLAGMAGLGGNAFFGSLFPKTNPNISSYLNSASLPFFLLDLAVIVLLYRSARKWLAKRQGVIAVSLGGLLIWLLFSALFLVALRVGSYMVSIPLLAVVLAQFLPEKWKITKLLPPAIATVLLAPNIVLAFLGTGMETLVLVNILVILYVELWKLW